MVTLGGERVSILRSEQRGLTLAFRGTLGRANAKLPCPTQSNSNLDQSFPAREQGCG